MSSTVFPSLVGLAWDVDRMPMWKTKIPIAASGKETRMQLWSYPRYQWTLTFNVLRQGVVAGTTYSELSQLMGFFNTLRGSYDTFLYTDVSDNAVTAQAIGVGDGSNKVFQLARTFGGNAEPVLAPNVVSTVYLNGVAQSGGSWSVSNWSSATPGKITFVTAPGAGVVVTADFTYYFPCRFVDDQITFTNFIDKMYSTKSISFISVKN